MSTVMIEHATEAESKIQYGAPPPLISPPIVTIPATAPSSPTFYPPTSDAPHLSPPLLDPRPRGLARPALVARTSTQSVRTVASSVQSIPEDGPLPPAEPAPKRSSNLGSNLPKLGFGGGAGIGLLARNKPDMSRDGYEMGSMGSGHKSAGSITGGTVFSAVTIGTGTKEDLAMAKWRKWAVDQPNVSVNTAENSPFPSRKPSTSTPTPSQSPYTIQPTAGSSFSSPSQFPSLSPSSAPSSSQSPRYLPDTPAYAEDTSSRSHSASDAGGQGPRALGSGEIYMTDTVRALQDVELAVDEDAMLRSAAQARQASRLLSNQPRLSTMENPFMDISSRLVSRRIRPVVLELVHALGHYIYTLWTLEHPDKPCPWIIRSDENAPAPLLRGWASRTITAVAEGLAQGLVDAPTPSTVAFWRAEVEYGLADVTEVVGKWKKRGMVFKIGLEKARYGEVEDDNVLGKGKAYEGGNIARLLNDLEEVLWGDANPRPTDLSFLLPTDFDPYAKLTEEELLAQQSAGGASSPGDVFGPSSSRPSAFDPLSANARAVMDEVHAMPDLIPPSPSRSPGSPGSPRRRRDGVRQGGDYLLAKPIGGGLGGGPSSNGKGREVAPLTLEEIGRMRHQEWMAKQGT